jgi:hypothetical protein
MALVALAAAALAGCGNDTVETAYGSSRGESINGTAALAEMFRARGSEVRTAVRMTDELLEWADVIVRFAPYPGPPGKEEAEWFDRWLEEGVDRRLVYVPRDYNAWTDYWTKVAEDLPSDAPEKLRSRVEQRRSRGQDSSDLPLIKPEKVASPDSWFAVESATGIPVTCQTLEGPWAQGIDAVKAAVRHRGTLKVDAEHVLLTCGRKATIAMEFTRDSDGKVLVLANGSFLLNGALVIPERRKLADRVVEWTGTGQEKVAFLDGGFVLGGEAEMPSVFGILERIPSIRWVVIQMMIVGIAACLARAPRLGRARSEPPSDADRPVAHAEALGQLLFRGGQSSRARSILEAYRAWRAPGGSGQAASSGAGASSRAGPGTDRLRGPSRAPQKDPDTPS